MKLTDSGRSRHAAYWNEACRRLQTRNVFEHIALQFVTADECGMLADLVSRTLLEQSRASIHARSPRVDNNLQDYLGSAEEPLLCRPMKSLDTLGLDLDKFLAPASVKGLVGAVIETSDDWTIHCFQGHLTRPCLDSVRK